MTESSPSWSEASEKLPHLAARHAMVQKVLKLVSEKLAEKGILAEHEQCEIPRDHPAATSFKGIFAEVFPTEPIPERLTYPVILKVYLQTSKSVFEEAGRFQRVVRQPRDSIEVAYIKSYIDPSTPLGELYDMYHFGPFRDVPEKLKELWESGFREGIAFERSEKARKKKRPARDRTMERSPLFWLTYHAWLRIQTDPRLQGRLKSFNKTSQLVEVLKQLGVTDTGNTLKYPTGKSGEEGETAFSTFRNDLTAWKRDFHGLHQTVK